MMADRIRTRESSRIDNHFPLLMAAGCGALLLVLYIIIFQLTLDQSLLEDFKDAATNIIPAMLLGTMVWLALKNLVLGRSLATQAAAHVCLGLAYGLSWYLLVLVGLGARDGSLASGFDVLPFSRTAFIWQMFQGITLYSLVALLTYIADLRREVIHLRGRLEQVQKSGDGPATRPAQLLFKVESEIVALEFDDVIRISGAGDYAEVVTTTGTYMSTTSLAKFEASVPEEKFVRAHRSHIVRLEAVMRAEPAGNGRLSLHLRNGDMIETSRTGSRNIKEATL